MKMIPPYPIEPSGKSFRSEIKIFELLKKIDFDSSLVGFHSLNISEHAYKKWGEIDFIILGEKGIYALEVKGGSIKCTENGIWHHTDRYGATHRKNESPMDQCRSATYSLLKLIMKDINVDINKYHNFGCGVIFPDIGWDIKTANMPREVVCDQNYMTPLKFERYIKNMVRHYHNSKKSNLSQKDIENIRGYLRPNLDLSPSLSKKSDETYNKLLKLTDEQWMYFNSSNRNARLMCIGGAGSGKSVLARHVALEKAGDNMKVLLTAKHPILIAYLKEQIKNKFVETRNIDVIPFDEIKNNISFYDSNYDCLIVDEAQDLMNYESLDVLEKVLVNGLEKGTWRFFMDDNGQANILGKYDNDAYKYLMKEGKVHDLIYNCRNTNQIIQEAEILSKARIGEARLKSEGIEVDTLHYENEEEKISKISKKLDELISEGIQLNDIAILSFVKFNQSCIQNLDKKRLGWIIEINKKNIIEENNKIIFSNIVEFKGLEKRNIILIDIDKANYDNEKLRSLLYTGITRAQIKLCIVIKIEKKVELMT